jgi:anti-sigma factor ChrR (cupin superfamily)
LNCVSFLVLSVESRKDEQDTEQDHDAIRKDMDPCIMLVKGSHCIALLGSEKV